MVSWFGICGSLLLLLLVHTWQVLKMLHVCEKNYGTNTLKILNYSLFFIFALYTPSGKPAILSCTCPSVSITTFTINLFYNNFLNYTKAHNRNKLYCTFPIAIGSAPVWDNKVNLPKQKRSKLSRESGLNLNRFFVFINLPYLYKLLKLN
jgi:hypothetical protein